MEEERSITRAAAGKALAAFLLVMALLTLGNRMLEEMTIATVSRTTTQRGALTKQFTGSGTLSAADTVPVLLTDSARVLSIPVAEGQYVAAGDTLLRLSYNDLIQTKQDAVDAAEDTVKSKQRTLDWAVADISTTTLSRITERIVAVDRLALAVEDAMAFGDAAAIEKAQYEYDTEKRRLDSDATARDYITKTEDLENAKADLAKAEGELAEMLAACDWNEKDGYVYTVVSPVSGTLQSLSASVGNSAGTGSPVAMIADATNGLMLAVTVDEDTAEELAVGDSASITVSSTVYNAPILAINASASRSGYYDLSFLLPGDAGAAGSSASMRIQKRTQNYDIIIPLTALYSDDDGDYVFVVEQSDSSLGSRMTVRRVDVYVLDSDGSRAALQSGVTQRDSIVTRSDRSISDGDRVRVEG